MHRPFLFLRLALLFSALLGLAACGTTRTHVDANATDLTKLQRIFVQTNLNDNHGLAEAITRALLARGLTATQGPLTLLPSDAQLVITYADHWAWDFGDHLVYLELGAGKPDPDFVKPFATATYQRNIGVRTQIPKVVDRLLGELLAAHRG